MNKATQKWYEEEAKVVFMEDVTTWDALRKEHWAVDDAYETFFGFANAPELKESLARFEENEKRMKAQAEAERLDTPTVCRQSTG